MGMQNTLNPLQNPYYSRGDFHGGTHAMLIDKLIGNSYEVVKHVAMNMDAIKHLSANLEMVYGVSQISEAILLLAGNVTLLQALSNDLLEGNISYPFSMADQAKLNSIAENASANSSDAYLLDRGNQTGTQSAATILVSGTTTLAAALAALTNQIAAATPPSQTQRIFTVDYAATVTLDFSMASTNEISLTGNVTSSSVIGVSTCPAFVRVRVIQDSVGGHAFAWPVAFSHHGDIDLAPNSISQQMFAKNLDGTFDDVSPMMFPKGV